MSAITPFIPESIEQATKLAEQLSRSSLLPAPLRGKPADVLVTLITGHELGLSPMQAIRGLHVIEGKAVMSADLTVALVKRHAECVFFRMVESSDAKSVYETERKGEGKTQLAFTIEQAQKAGLLGKDNWKKYPAAMLRARAASALARAVFPDLTLGVFDPDELNGDTQPTPPTNGKPIEKDVTPAAPPPAATSRAEQIKAKLAKRATIQDVTDAETEAKTPQMLRLEALAEKYGWGMVALIDLVKNVTGRARSSDMTEDDFGKLEAALMSLAVEPAATEAAAAPA